MTKRDKFYIRFHFFIQLIAQTRLSLDVIRAARRDLRGNTVAAGTVSRWRAWSFSRFTIICYLFSGGVEYSQIGCDSSIIAQSTTQPGKMKLFTIHFSFFTYHLGEGTTHSRFAHRRLGIIFADGLQRGHLSPIDH